jgi:hypothetical protein
MPLYTVRDKCLIFYASCQTAQTLDDSLRLDNAVPLSILQRECPFLPSVLQYRQIIRYDLAWSNFREVAAKFSSWRQRRLRLLLLLDHLSDVLGYHIAMHNAASFFSCRRHSRWRKL